MIPEPTPGAHNLIFLSSAFASPSQKKVVSIKQKMKRLPTFFIRPPFHPNRGLFSHPKPLLSRQQRLPLCCDRLAQLRGDADLVRKVFCPMIGPCGIDDGAGGRIVSG